MQQQRYVSGKCVIFPFKILLKDQFVRLAVCAKENGDLVLVVNSDIGPFALANASTLLRGVS